MLISFFVKLLTLVYDLCFGVFFSFFFFFFNVCHLLFFIEWLACWTQAQKGLGSNRCRVTVLGKLFTPILPLFTKQRNW